MVIKKIPHQHVKDAGRPLLKRKYIALNTNIRNDKRLKINYLSINLKKPKSKPIKFKETKI